MPQKSKVKFTEKEKQNLKEKEKDANTRASTPPAPSGSEKDGQNNKAADKSSRKSKKLKPGLAEMVTSDEMEDNSYDDSRIGQSSKWQDAPSTSSEPPTNSAGKFNLTLSDADKNVSEGSSSELEVPAVKLSDAADVCLQMNAAAAAAAVETGGGLEQLDRGTCGYGARVTQSKYTVSPCVKSADQPFATTDYATFAANRYNFIPKLIHPLNGQVSTFITHKEFTDYLKSSGCLRLFGTCILSVYRMKTWPAAEYLMEQILNSMGYQVPARKQIVDLTNRKQSLAQKLKMLTKERCQLLEKLDNYEETAAKYELLDQDEILPPRPDNSPLNMELMNQVFKNMEFASAAEEGRDNESTELKVIVSKRAPVSDTLPIPYHDKRMLH